MGRRGSQIVSPVGGRLQPAQRHDVAGMGLLDVLAAVGVHQQHAPDALARAP